MATKPLDRFHWFIQKSGIDFKQHQYDGVQWCLQNETSKLYCKGGFIADEMGLGKTITTIGLLISNFMLKTLIVLPNVLIQQWVNEIRRTTGHEPIVFYGPEKKTITFDQLCAAPIVITSYSTIAISREKFEEQPEKILHMVSWNRVVFDEAHHMRNKNARFWGAKKLLSPIKWLISGTPVQNKRKDFFNLCSVVGFDKPENIEEIIKTYVLRRTKAQVGIQLPQLDLDSKKVEWANDSERILSEDIHNSIRCADSFERLKLIMKARQICVYPAMLKTSMSGLIDDGIIPDYHIHENGCDFTSKLDAVIQFLLSRKGNGNGKLVFCHFREEIDFIVKKLKDLGNYDVATFDGRSSFIKRCETLREKHEVLVLQIQTGCEGLNLQKDFSEVYFVSPNWNPSMEEQSIARCHRIGQTKPVHVFRFHMVTYLPDNSENMNPSLDQYIQGVQQHKREIIREIIAPGNPDFS
jgi:SNF2 family DNA or RNA helicase